MWATIISTTLSLIQQVAPNAVPAVVVSAITSLEALVPAIIQEARDLLPTVSNVITTLKGNGGTTQEQLDRLDALEAVIDADYEAALAAAKAEDAAG